MTHTKEPWQDDPRGHGVVTDSNGRTVCTVNFASDARRLVACVNACAGIPTDWLETCAKDQTCDPEILEPVVADLSRKRDELLQELRYIANAPTQEWDDQREFEAWAKNRARHAIAKAEAA